MKVCNYCGSPYVSVLVWMAAEGSDEAMYGNFSKADVQEFASKKNPTEAAETHKSRHYYCDNCDHCTGVVELVEWESAIAEQAERVRARGQPRSQKPYVTARTAMGQLIR